MLHLALQLQAGLKDCRFWGCTGGFGLGAFPSLCSESMALRAPLKTDASGGRFPIRFGKARATISLLFQRSKFHVQHFCAHCFLVFCVCFCYNKRKILLYIICLHSPPALWPVPGRLPVASRSRAPGLLSPVALGPGPRFPALLSRCPACSAAVWGAVPVPPVVPPAGFRLRSGGRALLRLPPELRRSSSLFFRSKK